MSNISKIAKGFSAIGSEQRLLVYMTLVQNAPRGLSIKEVQEILDMKPSTLAHHIKFLVDANLIKQERKGKEVLNYANIEELKCLCGSIIDQCCMCNDNTKE